MKLAVDNKTVDVVEAYPYEKSPPEAIVVGDNGKLWMQGRMSGGPVVAEGTAYLELQVKNHCNTSPEYIIPPGAKGVTNLVFGVPKLSRGVQGGTLDGESEGDGGQPRQTESLFEIRCEVEVKLGMGIGSKDTTLQIPIDVVHPMAVPQQPILDSFIQQQPMPYTYANLAPVPELMPYADYTSYYPHQGIYINPTQIQPWLPPMEPPPPLPRGYLHGYLLLLYLICLQYLTKPPLWNLHKNHSLTISKSERVKDLEKMADEVAKRIRDLSGDPPKAATLEDLD
ncbi:hypothetical protein BYT27DRAFT_7216951 [Phlegmacium glaucopus]|nr:hypothetical protein BYT27DRAFT_7216951 [Phlegmacium glaucopus]